MTLVRLLLLKDLKRTWRNPVPFLILILIPFVITALIGVAFGQMSRGDTESLAPIRLGMVDEDDSLFSQFMEGAVSNDDFREHIDARFLERTEAEMMVSRGELSAVLIIPEGFTAQFLDGEPTQLILIKNPSEYIYPTLAQEGADLIVTALNAIARNFRQDLQELRGVLDSDRELDLFQDVMGVTTIVSRAMNRLEAADDYLTPPLVQYKETKQAETEEEGSSFSLFSFLLIGMAAMFLLMIADNCMRDLYRESRFRTLERYQTLRGGLLGFVTAKVIYAIVVLMLAVLILFGLGGLIFQFQWMNLPQVFILVVGYALFGAGMMGFFAALAGKEKRADILNNVLVMAMAIPGGAMWPPQQLPPVIRENITPYSPAFWFSSAVRGLQSDYPGYDWMQASLQLYAIGILFIIGAAWGFRLRLERGIRE